MTDAFAGADRRLKATVSRSGGGGWQRSTRPTTLEEAREREEQEVPDNLVVVLEGVTRDVEGLESLNRRLRSYLEGDYDDPLTLHIDPQTREVTVTF